MAEHYLVDAHWAPPVCGNHEVRFETREDAITAAQSTRDAFPDTAIYVYIVRYGQRCAIGTFDWWPGIAATDEARVHQQALRDLWAAQDRAMANAVA